MDPPADRPARRKGYLSVVVDNGPTMLEDEFDISPEEINSGVEEWS